MSEHLAQRTAAGRSVVLRQASQADLPALVALLGDDPLGAGREHEELTPYAAALAEITADPSELLVVAEIDGEVVGTLQLSFLPGLARGGARRGQIEAVRVRSGERRLGIGTVMLGWAVEECRRRGCRLVQLTSDLRRPEAHRLYRRLGFEASHAGFKLDLGR